MATASVTNTFVAATTAQSAQVNQNYTDVVSFLNNSTAHVDGSKAFTGIPTLPATDPTTDNQATRKIYVDNADASKLALVGGTMLGAILAASGFVETPGVAFNGDADTGMFRSGGNLFGLAAGGVEHLRVDGTNNLVEILSGDDVTLSDSAGWLTVGAHDAAHMAFDENEIQAKGSATTDAKIHLNTNGGGFAIGESAGTDTSYFYGDDIRCPDFASLAGSTNAVMLSNTNRIFGYQSSALANKKDFQDIDGDRAVGFVREVDPFFYRTNQEWELDPWLHPGYGAEPMLEAFPELALMQTDPETGEHTPISVKYDRVPAVLHRAMQVMLERIEELESA